jgi:hypothetical protein
MRDAGIGSRLRGWLLARKFGRVTRRADTLFRQTCHDPDLARYMIGLPLADLPKIRTELAALPDQPDQQALRDAVHRAISRDWRQLSPAQIDRAVDVYLCSLGRALLPVAQAQPVHRTRLRARTLA